MRVKPSPWVGLKTDLGSGWIHPWLLANISSNGFNNYLMKMVNRPTRTTAELIALINQHQADWWPAEFQITIGRSAEHDWIAIADVQNNDFGIRGTDFSNSLAKVVADLRLRNAWAGH